jgi:HK97 family phage major capsid protein
MSFSGIPIIMHTSDPTGDDGSGDVVDAIYGNFNQAVKIKRRGGINIDVSDQRYWDANATAVRAVMYWDFVVHDFGSDTVAGPIVALFQT